MLTIKIINGLLFDGTGNDPQRMDVGITGSSIEVISDDLSDAEAKHTIDAQDCVVCPGFIDTHTHSDTYLLLEPSAPSKTFQGVTTEIIGNCGASASPLTGRYNMPSDWASHADEYPGKWSSVAEYRELLEQVRPAPNVVILTGHNTLRGGVMGYENRVASPDEIEAMSDLLAKSMDEGSHGLSTGLVYAPGLFASREEVVSLAKVAGGRAGIYTSHIRNESSKLLEAIDEAISIGQDSGVRTQISHLKVSGSANWHLIDELLKKIPTARADGADVASDRYPYTSSCTDLDIVFPEWATEGGREAVLARLRDSSLRSRLREDLLKEHGEDYWSTITIGSTTHSDNHKFQGSPLLDVAEKLSMEPVDALLHLVDTDELRTSAFFQSMSEENMLRILEEPYVMIGSDASLRATTGPLSKEYSHPRAYGSNAGFLRMSIDKKTVGLSEAIRKMTSLPAEQFRLKKRGSIKREYKADITVFDPDTVKGRSTYAEPHQLAEGIKHVIVNGVMTLTNGNLTGKRAGEVL